MAFVFSLMTKYTVTELHKYRTLRLVYSWNIAMIDMIIREQAKD